MTASVSQGRDELDIRSYGAPAWLANGAWLSVGDPALADPAWARSIGQAFEGEGGDALVFFPLPLTLPGQAQMPGQEAFSTAMDRTRTACAAAVASMRKRSFGRIVLVAPSFPVLVPESAAGWQFSSWLAGLTRGLALEVAAQGITVNAVLLGLPTASGEPTKPDEPTEPAGQGSVSADELEHAIWLFLERGAGYLTGQVMHLCGGKSMVSVFSY